MNNDVVPISNLRALENAIRKIGFDVIEGQENGIPVLTVSVQDRMIVALVHNQCLKLMFRLREKEFSGRAGFATNWNAMNFVGTLIPVTDGFLLKHESLASNGLVIGNIKDTLTLFADSIDKFSEEWFELTS